MALLPNRNLVIGNTSTQRYEPDGGDLARGKLLDVRNVDKGAAGALFGIAASGTTDIRYEDLFQRRQRQRSPSARKIAPATEAFPAFFTFNWSHENLTR